MITIITGGRGVGKTTLLIKLIEEIKSHCSKTAGILTPGIYDKKGDKVGFYAMSAADGEQWELGRSDKELEGPSYGPFSFSKRGFEKANTILTEVLTEGPGDLFLDEIGPLELEKREGFYPVLPLLSKFDQNRNLYLIIRPELIDIFIGRFISYKEYKIIEITSENRDGIVIWKQ